MIEEREEIETYGRHRNWKPAVRVVLFMTSLFVFVIVLTIARGFIFEEGVVKSKNDEVEKAEASVEEKQGKKEGKKVTITHKTDGGGSNIDFEEIDYDYDISDLLESEMVQDLPKKASISLKIGGEYYIVSRNSVVAGRAANPDISISLPVRYVSQISQGLCKMIEDANSDGMLVVETHISQASLMWKYRGMLKYRGCLS